MNKNYLLLLTIELKTKKKERKERNSDG